MTPQSKSRREFLTIATAAAGTFAMPSLADAAPKVTGQANMTKTGRANQIFKPEFQFGLGGVPLGNEFEVVTDDDAMKTMEASWNAGVRYFDVSPWYGLGLAERRYGAFLHKQERNSYLIPPRSESCSRPRPATIPKSCFPTPIHPTTSSLTTQRTASGVRSKIACSGSA